MRLFANRVEHKAGRWACLRWYDIVIGGILYLSRFQIWKTPLQSTKIHWIHLPDPDRDLHDHRWPFFSIVIWGGYTELECKDPTGEKKVVEKKIRWWNFKNRITAHRITSVKPNTITLVFTGRKKGSWGFYDEHTFEYTDWKDYEKAT